MNLTLPCLSLINGNRQVKAVALAFILATPDILFAADSFNADFQTGPGSSFTTENSHGLWTLDLDGPSFRVSKTADPGTLGANEFVSGGINSQFALLGNFSVTVDFTHNAFPPAGPNPSGLNESMLSVNGDVSNESLLVLRYNTGSASRLEAFGTSPIGDRDSSLSDGRYRIERSGNTLTASFASAGSETFTTLGSIGVTSSQFTVGLRATQGMNEGVRSTTALDISFDNLTIQADAIVPIPEPSTQVLVVASLAALIGLRGRKAR